METVCFNFRNGSETKSEALLDFVKHVQKDWKGVCLPSDFRPTYTL